MGRFGPGARMVRADLRALPEHQADSEPFRQLVFTARTDRLKAIKAKLVSTEEHRASLDQIVSRVAEFTRSVPSQRSLIVSGSFDDILSRLHKLTRELSDVLLRDSPRCHQ